MQNYTGKCIFCLLRQYFCKVWLISHGSTLEIIFFLSFFRLSQIHYHPVGCTNTSLAEIESYVNSHDSIGTIYNVFHNSCQDYVASVISYLFLPYPGQENTMKVAKTSADINLNDEFNMLNLINPRAFGGTGGIDMVGLLGEMEKVRRN